MKNIFETIWESIEQVFIKFEFRRIFFLLFVIIIIVIVVIGFEYYTGYSYYLHVDKKIAALSNLYALEKEGILESDLLSPIYKETVKELESAITPQLTFSFDLYPFIKLFSAILLPILILGVGIVELKKGDQDSRYTIIGAILLVIILGVIGLAIPTFSNKWINPIGYILVQGSLVIILAMLSKSE